MDEAKVKNCDESCLTYWEGECKTTKRKDYKCDKEEKYEEHKCPYCGGNYEIETCCTSSDIDFDDETEEWVTWQGFIERTRCCKHRLGEGYGDMNSYPTAEEAQRIHEEWKRKIGVWF